LNNVREKIMRFIIVVTVLAFPAFVHATTIHVPADQPTIQDGIDAAGNRDTVLVAPGTYVENIDFLGKAITVTSSGGAGATIIDGGNPTDPDYGSCVVFENGEGPDSVLDGFTLLNGGGTVYGIPGYFLWYGGGICCYNTSSPTIMNNTISGNSANLGGGISCESYCDPAIINNTISDNTAGVGGGISCKYYSSPAIINNTISDNTAGNKGGGIYTVGGGSSPTIINNTITGNMASNNGGGICCDHTSISATSNNIFWNNDASEGPEIYIGHKNNPSRLIISYSDVKGGQASVHVEPNCTLYWGAGIIDTDPLIVKFGYWDDNGTPSNPWDDFWVDGDYHLKFISPCRGSGDNSTITEPYDIEGDPRIAYGTVDMGADEFYRHLYYTGDATPGGSLEMKFVGDPGTAQVGLIIGFSVFDPPIPGAYGNWYMKQPILLVLGLGPIPSDGVYVLPGTLPPTPPGPYTVYFQAMIGMKLLIRALFN